MKLIVGLGNPGKEYEKTRHNVGFMVIDSYCSKRSLSFKKKFEGLYAKEVINDEEVIFLKPQKYMNLSGNVIKKYMDYFKIDISNLLVIYDDKDFEIGKVKIKPDGSSGGHNGIKDLILHLGSSNFKRIRIGISKNEKNMVKHVLGKFTKIETVKIDQTINNIIDVIEDYIEISFENLMNKYN